jgi:molybdate transport system permease protein
LDWTALTLSLELAGWTLLVLLPTGVLLARYLARARMRGRALVEAAVAMPLVLPPTVLGFYLLQLLGAGSPLAAVFERLAGGPLAFSFSGLVVASVIVNLPFAVQPVQRAFEAIDPELYDAAASCGLTPWATFLRIELPLALPGVLTAAVLTFAHTLGEFGVVLMVGGAIPGETRTIAIAIYDRVQAFDEPAANRMALFLLAVSIAAMAAALLLGRRIGTRR